MKSRIIGVAIFILVIATALTLYFMQGGGKQQVELKGLIGGEKQGLLQDEQVIKILKIKYGITISFKTAGSLDMANNPGDSDFIFPSSQLALEIYEEAKGVGTAKSKTIFNSPIVLYSWGPVVDALSKQGMVKKTGQSYYVVDFPKLIDFIEQGKKWSDIGLPELYGKMAIISTDPTRSNSGNMFYGLLANILNKGDVVDEASVQPILPKLKSFYSKLGYLENSSSKLFDSYLNKGMGENPIIVGYENQLEEFATQNPDLWKNVKDKVRILYPLPTVWSSHQLITITPKASLLIDAMSDKDIQKIAWEKHGFRTGISGIVNDTKVLQIVGIPESVDQILPMPKAKIMEEIIKALQ